MTADAAAVHWMPLSALAGRFAANVAALGGRDPGLADQLRALAPATAYVVAVQGGGLALGAAGPDDVGPLPSLLPAARVAAIAEQLCPTGTYTEPVLIAGEDQGWLWDRLYRLPARSVQGHRPPLYFVIADLERLWVMLHLQDWQQLLADPRVQLFAGPDATERLGRSFADDWWLTWPARWATVGDGVWPAGVTVDTLRAAAATARAQALIRLAEPATAAEAAAVARRVAGGGRLRVLGLTSRYTTFLQHSMRDWLAAFERLGHEVRIMIEPADHHTLCPLVVPALCRDFRPDLIVQIDHYRAEHPVLPAHVPAVMWVQDRLPNIYRPAAGAAQGPLDFCLGSGRLQLTRDHGYPADRFMTCPVGTNTDRFTAGLPTAAERARFGCDVSYVSHASTTADALVADACRQMPPPFAELLADVLGRMRAHYAADPRILITEMVRPLLADAEAATGVPVPEAFRPELLVFLNQQVNNALVRHDALTWVADAGVDLRLYGKGWDRHPTLARFARGPADNQSELSAIYRCSAVNLQVTPFGCIHQRMLDGLSAGGFFLARWHQADAVTDTYRQIWSWCGANAIADADDLRRQASPEVDRMLRRLADQFGWETPGDWAVQFEAIRTAADTGFTVSADGVWGEDYDRVAFRTGAELRDKVRAALADPAGRRAVADRMRAAVVDRFSYRAITARLLQTIARQMPRAQTRTLPEAA